MGRSNDRSDCNCDDVLMLLIITELSDHFTHYSINTRPASTGGIKTPNGFQVWLEQLYFINSDQFKTGVYKQ